ncbi:MAG: hypothetical protein U0075_09730 [Thermomicrobiales bacterium]
MNTYALDTVSRRAAEAISRRRSLLAVSGAALGVTMARPLSSEAKGGNTCKKKAKKQCANDAAACKTSVLALCDAPGSPQCVGLQACCESCSAAGFMTCLIEFQQQQEQQP